MTGMREGPWLRLPSSRRTMINTALRSGDSRSGKTRHPSWPTLPLIFLPLTSLYFFSKLRSSYSRYLRRVASASSPLPLTFSILTMHWQRHCRFFHFVDGFIVRQAYNSSSLSRLGYFERMPSTWSTSGW